MNEDSPKAIAQHEYCQWIGIQSLLMFWIAIGYQKMNIIAILLSLITATLATY